jgi:hypothetical protein
VGLHFESEENICKIVNGQTPALWENGWISSDALKSAVKVEKIVVGAVADANERVQAEEVALFEENAWAY